MGNKIEIPKEWQSTNDWDSHRPMLYAVIKNISGGNIVELGCGEGSTRLLYDAFINKDGCDCFASLETNPVYANQFEYTDLVDSYDEAFGFMPCGILFVDCAPGEIRKDLIAKYANEASVVVVHDTEPGAEYVYHMAEVLNSFKYRLDYKPEGKPWTTAVSNCIDITKWELPND